MSGESDAVPAAPIPPVASIAKQVWQFRLSMVILIAWIVFLAATVWRTANPVLISRQQILTATLIVKGKFRLEPVRLEVLTVWRGDATLVGKTLDIVGFAPPADFNAEVSYIVALEPIGNRKARIAETPSEPGIGTVIDDRVYPATQQALQQLKELLEARERLELKAVKP